MAFGKQRPTFFHHHGNTVDHHIKKAADQQAKNQGKRDGKRGVKALNRHSH